MFNLRSLQRYPPWVIRTVARRKVGGDRSRRVEPLTTKEIAAASGLGIRRVIYIASQPNWDRVSVGEAVRFIQGCGFDPGRMFLVEWYLKRSARFTNAFAFLDRLPSRERKRVSGIFSRHADQWYETLKAQSHEQSQ